MKRFSSMKDVYKFVHNEGDHLVDWWAGEDYGPLNKA